MRPRGVAKILDFKKKMIVWGSPTIIEEWNSLEDDNDERSDLENLVHMDDILREVRRDLGHYNKGLKRGRLLGLFLKPNARRDLFRAVAERKKLSNR